jgi:hypothetical protein
MPRIGSREKVFCSFEIGVLAWYIKKDAELYYEIEKEVEIGDESRKKEEQRT